jgi:SAM-dependent methyltransferase
VDRWVDLLRIIAADHSKSVKGLLRRLRNRFRRYSCPFCGLGTDSWKPMGLDLPVLREKQVSGAGLRNAACPSCGSTDRERLIHVHLAHERRLFEDRNLRILHVAPEKHLSRELMRHGFAEYVCGDLFTEGYAYPAHVMNMNVLHIPFEDGHFDLVICNHVLEHVPEDIAAMREILRVLKPGGQALLQVPLSANSSATHEDPTITDPRERERLFGQYDHMRIYGQDLVQRLESAGFRVERRNLAAKYKRWGLDPREDLFICMKP